MAEAIYCRIKFAVLLGLFFLPILVSMWNRHIDMQIEEARYLPAPASLAWSASGNQDPEPVLPEVADESDPLPVEIP